MLAKHLSKIVFLQYLTNTCHLHHYHPSPEISTNQEFSAQEIKIYESCILPVYVQGVLVKIDTPNDIANKLQDLVIAYNSSTLKTTTLSLGK